MKNWILILSFSINDILNTASSYWKDLDVNIVGEVVQEFCAAIILIIVFAIYKKIKGETVSETINKILSKKKNEKNP